MSFAVLANLAGILVWSLAAAAAAGLACVAYGSLIERHWYRRASYRVAALPDAAPPLTILHVSDLHMVAKDRRKAAFLASLPQADVCVVTGDILGEPEAVDAAVEALRPLRAELPLRYWRQQAHLTTPASDAAMARKAEDRNSSVSAGEGYLRAAICHHFGKFIFF